MSIVLLTLIYIIMSNRVEKFNKMRNKLVSAENKIYALERRIRTLEQSNKELNERVRRYKRVPRWWQIWKKKYIYY